MIVFFNTWWSTIIVIVIAADNTPRGLSNSPLSTEALSDASITFLNSNSSLLLRKNTETGDVNPIDQELLNEEKANVLLAAIDRLRQKIIDKILSRWSVPRGALQNIPLSILVQLTSVSPLSLIGCSVGTVPFDLETCTDGIQNEHDIEGTCPNPTVTFDAKLRVCTVPSSTEASLSCPDGFRIALPPSGTLKGGCRRNNAVDPEPACDPPYIYSEIENICVKRSATAGYVGCRPGEIRKGNKCLIAYQVLMDIDCPTGFTAKITNSDIPTCEKIIRYNGDWNLYASRPICQTEAATAYVDRIGDSMWLDASVRLNPSLMLALPNVTCEERHTMPPSSVHCPNKTIDYDTYISYGNLPPIQFDSHLGNPKWTCVGIKELPIAPSCPLANHLVLFKGSAENLLRDFATAQPAPTVREAFKPENFIPGLARSPTSDIVDEDIPVINPEADSGVAAAEHSFRMPDDIPNFETGTRRRRRLFSHDLFNTPNYDIITTVRQQHPYEDSEQRHTQTQFLIDYKSNTNLKKDTNFFRRQTEFHLDDHGTGRRNRKKEAREKNKIKDGIINTLFSNTYSAKMVKDNDKSSIMSFSHDVSKPIKSLQEENTVITATANQLILQETTLESTSNIIEQSHQQKTNFLYDTNNRTIETQRYENLQPLPSSGDEILVTDWNEFTPVDAFIQEAESRGITQINWLAAYLNGTLEIICGSVSSAQFYLRCPQHYRLRKDGSCLGKGYTNFIVSCPEGFALDQLALTESNYRFPKPMCHGQLPTATVYSCPKSMTLFENNSIMNHNYCSRINKEIKRIQISSTDHQKKKEENEILDEDIIFYETNDNTETSLAIDQLNWKKIENVIQEESAQLRLPKLSFDFNNNLEYEPIGRQDLLKCLKKYDEENRIMSNDSNKLDYQNNKNNKSFKNPVELNPEGSVKSFLAKENQNVDYNYCIEQQQQQQQKRGKDASNHYYYSKKQETKTDEKAFATPLLDDGYTVSTSDIVNEEIDIEQHKKDKYEALGESLKDPNLKFSKYLSYLIQNLKEHSVNISPTEILRVLDQIETVLKSYVHPQIKQTEVRDIAKTSNADIEYLDALIFSSINTRFLKNENMTSLPANTLTAFIQKFITNGTDPPVDFAQNSASPSLELFKDENLKTCYTARRYPAYYSPPEDLILTLFGRTFGGEFLNRIRQAKKAGGSPFFPIIPKMWEREDQCHNSNNNPEIAKMVKEEEFKKKKIAFFDELQRAPQFVSNYPSYVLPTIPKHMNFFSSVIAKRDRLVPEM